MKYINYVQFCSYFIGFTITGFLSKRQAVSANIHRIAHEIIGAGSSNSATIGAAIVKKFATKFTRPKTVATNLVGKSLATETYPILNDIAPPTRERHTRNGINQPTSAV